MNMKRKPTPKPETPAALDLPEALALIAKLDAEVSNFIDRWADLRTAVTDLRNGTDKTSLPESPESQEVRFETAALVDEILDDLETKYTT